MILSAASSSSQPRPLKDLFSPMFIDRWAFDVEALALAHKLNYRIKEVAARWFHNPDSRLTMSAYIKTFVELLRIKHLLITNAHMSDRTFDGLENPATSQFYCMSRKKTGRWLMSPDACPQPREKRPG